MRPTHKKTMINYTSLTVQQQGLHHLLIQVTISGNSCHNLW